MFSRIKDAFRAAAMELRRVLSPEQVAYRAMRKAYKRKPAEEILGYLASHAKPLGLTYHDDPGFGDFLDNTFALAGEQHAVASAPVPETRRGRVASLLRRGPKAAAKGVAWGDIAAHLGTLALAAPADSALTKQSFAYLDHALTHAAAGDAPETALESMATLALKAPPASQQQLHFLIRAMTLAEGAIAANPTDSVETLIRLASNLPYGMTHQAAIFDRCVEVLAQNPEIKMATRVKFAAEIAEHEMVARGEDMFEAVKNNAHAALRGSLGALYLSNRAVGAWRGWRLEKSSDPDVSATAREVRSAFGLFGSHRLSAGDAAITLRTGIRSGSVQRWFRKRAQREAAWAARPRPQAPVFGNPAPQPA